MGSARIPAAIMDTKACEGRSVDLSAERFAYISDNTYTPQEVEEFTLVGWLGVGCWTPKGQPWREERTQGLAPLVGAFACQRVC